MSGEYEDIMAAFNIPATEGQKVKPTAAADDKPALTSPKKLALNVKASTVDRPEVDSDDDDGWIIDETASGDAKPDKAPGQVQNGQSDKKGQRVQKTQEVEPQKRRKQVFPKGSQQQPQSPPGTIPTSYTPIQGWKGAPPRNSSTSLSGYLQTPKTFSMMKTASGGDVPRVLPAVPPGTSAGEGGIIPPIHTFTQSYRPLGQPTGPILPSFVAPPPPGMQSPRSYQHVPSNTPLPVHVPDAPRTVALPASPYQTTVQTLGTSPPSSFGSSAVSNIQPVQRKRIIEQIKIPVIDPLSVVGKGTVMSPPKLAPKLAPNRHDPPQDTWTLSGISAKKLVHPNLKISKVYKPTVRLDKYQEFDAPEGGYHCKACACTFLSEESLATHLNRPSFIATFTCVDCTSQKLQKFYNRCALWKHLLLHSKDTSKLYDKLSKSLRIQPFTQREFLDYNFGDDCQKDLPGLPKTNAVSSVTRKKSFKCSGCNAVVNDLLYETHLSRLVRPSMTVCQICRRLLRNPCEKQLHKVMHKKKNLCPGCGTAHSTPSEYFAHASAHTCLYWLSVPLLVCSLCLQPHYSLEEFSKHLCERHHVSYYKCDLCQLAFRGASALYDHHCKEHAGKATPQLTGLSQILKCPLCKNVFNGSDVLQTHLENSHFIDMTSRVHKYVYRCSWCPTASRNFFDRAGMVNHIVASHKISSMPVLCDLCGMHLSSVSSFHDHRHGCHKFVRKRKEERRKEATTERPGLGASSESKRVLRCSHCPSASRVFYSTEASFNGHCKATHPGVTPYPVWVELITGTVADIQSAANNARANDKGVKTAPTPMTTTIAPITSSNTILPIPGSKSIRPIPECNTILPAGKASTGISASAPRQVSSNAIKRPSVDEVEQASKKAKTDIQQNGIGREPKEEVIEKATIPEGPLNCAKCDFTSKERAVFQEHIKTHKTNPNHQQCQECGICFRSTMAVTRHMAMIHQIQKPVAPVVIPVFPQAEERPKQKEQPPLKKKPTPPPTRVATPPPVVHEVKGESMECTVCYRKFTSDLQLRNHMRTHGMAFIRSKRTSRDRPGT